MAPSVASFRTMQASCQKPAADTCTLVRWVVGGCWALSAIAAAVWSGRRFAAELEEELDADKPFRRELAIRFSGRCG